DDGVLLRGTHAGNPPGRDYRLGAGLVQGAGGPRRDIISPSPCPLPHWGRGMRRRISPSPSYRERRGMRRGAIMTTLPTVSFSHFGLYVTDLPRMEDFYTRVLGLLV